MEKENQYSRSVSEYEEIDLRDVFNVLIRKKKIIIFCAAAGLTAALVANAVLPRIYRAQTKIEVGSFEMSAGKAVSLADVAQLKDKIEQGAYGTNDKSSCVLKTAAASGSNIIAVTAECADSSAAKDVLSEIAQAVIAEHEKMIAARRQIIEDQIKNYEANAKEIKNSFQYSADRSCSTERYLASGKLENLVLESKFALSHLNGTAVVLAPTAPETPVKPNRGLNVSLGLILGLFAGIFAALAKDWWSNTKNQ
ncbi:MAG TPA: Wzz/FepE/Etk N-terminal domain-containing protein [Candidatus Pacearchaeota archaeon]|nr:Wzz/FepE/Etk N-terminal domain-containing protein [Candidatus Pacearchaeota archaeon]